MDGDLLVALDTAIDDGLAAEGMAREVAHRIQGLRKSAGLAIDDRIVVAVGAPASVLAQLEPHRAWLAEETLARELTLGDDADLDRAATREAVDLDGVALRLALRRAE